MAIAAASVIFVVLALSAAATAAPATPVSSKGFDVQRGVQFLQYSWASFCPAAQLTAWNCQWCVDKHFVCVGTVYDKDTEAYGFVGYNPLNQTTVIAFRGSSNIMNWLNDFDFLPVKFGNYSCQVHAGFYRCWKNLRSQVVALMESIWNSKCPTCTNVVFTGQSLGAAITGLGAIDTLLSYSSKFKFSLINYGMPRVGDKAFTDLFDSHLPDSQRMVHQDDIVPHLPPKDVGYNHITTEIWDQTQGTVQTYKVCDPKNGEDPTCSDSIPAEKWSTADHNDYMGIPNNNCGQ